MNNFRTIMHERRAHFSNQGAIRFGIGSCSGFSSRSDTFRPRAVSSGTGHLSLHFQMVVLVAVARKIIFTRLQTLLRHGNYLIKYLCITHLYSPKSMLAQKYVYTPCLKKLCQHIFCSLSVKYEQILTKIGGIVLE